MKKFYCWTKAISCLVLAIVLSVAWNHQNASLPLSTSPNTNQYSDLSQQLLKADDDTCCNCVGKAIGIKHSFLHYAMLLDPFTNKNSLPVSRNIDFYTGKASNLQEPPTVRAMLHACFHYRSNNKHSSWLCCD